jgi:hypothetical protein
MGIKHTVSLMSCINHHILYTNLDLQKEDALKLWGEPQSLADITELFGRFCIGQLEALPWTDAKLATETSAIASQLAEMNKLGFLTINSQPAVNGARSDDKVFGWGPSNGFVYQKVRLCNRIDLSLSWLSTPPTCRHTWNSSSLLAC